MTGCPNKPKELAVNIQVQGVPINRTGNKYIGQGVPINKTGSKYI